MFSLSCLVKNPNYKIVWTLGGQDQYAADRRCVQKKAGGFCTKYPWESFLGNGWDHRHFNFLFLNYAYCSSHFLLLKCIPEAITEFLRVGRHSVLWVGCRGGPVPLASSLVVKQVLYLEDLWVAESLRRPVPGAFPSCLGPWHSFPAAWLACTRGHSLLVL